jgi:UDP-glucose 4-epimerase
VTVQQSFIARAARPGSASSLSRKRVLVTGASGFIGSHLCRRLSREGAEVCAVSRTIPAPGSDPARRIRADISDYDTAQRIVGEAKPDVVFHLAGHVQGSRSLEQVRPAFIGNVVTTVNLLTIASEARCERFILTGSQDEPDPGESSADTFVPPSPYAASKLASSSYARMFWEVHRLPVSIARIYMAYGPAQRDLNKLIPYAILSLAHGRAPRLSRGTRPIDWIYIDDVVDGLIATAQSRDLNGLTVGLGTGVAHTVPQVVDKIIALMNSPIRPIFGAVPTRRLEKARLGNVADTRAKIGWQPAVSLDEGLQRTVAWYCDRVAEMPRSQRVYAR